VKQRRSRYAETRQRAWCRGELSDRMWNDQTLHDPKSKTIASAAAATTTAQSTIAIRCFGSLNILISGGDNPDPAQALANQW
jgi:hypothetical protein